MAVLSPMPIGKQVFLLGINTITTVMLCMTPAVTTVKKAAVGVKKSPADAGTKTAALRVYLPGAPKAPPRPSPREGTEKLKTTIKLKVDDGEIAVLPFIICLF